MEREVLGVRSEREVLGGCVCVRERERERERVMSLTLRPTKRMLLTPNKRENSPMNTNKDKC